MKNLKNHNNLRRVIVSLLIGLIALSGTYSVKASQIEQPFEIFAPIIMNGNPGYFVSPAGNDLNPGTYNFPWKTIGKAARSVVPGDTVYVRAGIYQEALNLSTSGTEQLPILFSAFPGETPVIDGNGVLPGTERGLVYLQGDWIHISGFEVRNSSYSGVHLYGHHNLASNIFSHHNYKNGIYVQGDYGTVENSLIWQNALINENNKAGNGSSALTTSRDKVNGTTDYAILRNNTVWENWGIGIDSYESNGTIIERNVVHDNLIGNIYISDATNILCTQNLIYMTPGSITYGKSSNFGILLGDEVYNPKSANITISNNIAYGNNLNFKWWKGTDDKGVMNNILIANNTFVNSMPNDNGNANVDIPYNADHQNVRIINNIIVQDDSATYIEDIKMSLGIYLAHNLWSRAPHAAVLGTGDIVADPKLARTGTPYSYQWYALLTGSPAINSALVLPEVTFDFLGNARGPTPDRGALEK